MSVVDVLFKVAAVVPTLFTTIKKIGDAVARDGDGGKRVTLEEIAEIGEEGKKLIERIAEVFRRPA